MVLLFWSNQSPPKMDEDLDISDIHKAKPQRITEKGIQILQNKFLTNLYLKSMELRDKDAEIISNCLKNNHSMIHLDLSDNKIGPEGAKFIGRLINETSLIKLNLGKNRMEDGVAHFGEALRKNKSLKNLDLSHNDINETGFKCIFNSLMDHQSIFELDMSQNALGQVGIRSIGDFLMKNKTLKKLDLSGCSINSLDLLTNSLKYNSSLISLHLNENNISKVKKLGESLGFNTSLNILYIGFNLISDHESSYFFQELEKNQTLTKLGMEYNSVGNEGLKYLSAVLSNANTKLKWINLIQNEFDDEGMEFLSKSLEMNHSLEYLSISNFSFSSKTFAELSSSLTNNFSLKKLEISTQSLNVQSQQSFANILKGNQNWNKINNQFQMFSNCGTLQNVKFKFKIKNLF
jgi:Ran GTPase-activating protein (RanGAP) involved in mRNA processing and transport